MNLRGVTMTENVNEKESFPRLGFLVGLQPRRDLIEDSLVVFHVLHHLNSDDSVEAGIPPRRGELVSKDRDQNKLHSRSGTRKVVNIDITSEYGNIG